jgi:hypothetical protein
MDPRDAISRIEQIREHLAREEVFRVYRHASVASTGVMAFLGGLVQSRWELSDPERFLVLWISVALLCVLVIGIEMTIRCRYSESVLMRDAAAVAARQFAPCLIAGGLLTLVIYRFIPDAIHMLPGLWAIAFALGVFASRAGLPWTINIVGAWYLLGGLLTLALANNRVTFEVWPMPLTFGTGQILTAIILYLSTQRSYDPEQ